MSVQWTENQRRAIDARGGNVLVSAAAGSGKTAVLVERVIRRVTDAAEPVLINRLLIATFTNAAAAEMRERVHAALSAELERHPDHAFLRKQLVLLGQAQITTVHAFCQNLIKDNFHALDIPVDFEIGDEAKTVPLLRQAAEAVLNGHYEQQEEAFFRTVDAFGGKKTDDDLIEMLFALYRFSRSLAHPDEWLGRCADGLRSESDVEAYAQVVFRQARIAMSGLAALYGAALERIEADEGLKPYEPLFRSERAGLSEMAQAPRERMQALLLAWSFARLPRKGKDAAAEDVQFVKQVRDIAKKQIAVFSELCTMPAAEIYDEALQMQPCVTVLCRLTMELAEEYSRRKLERNLLDFNDLERYAIRLLEEHADLRERIQGGFDEILVDEYQDTNGVQARLFELLSNGHNLFMVGDVKQSIYGFRNAQPRYFMEKYKAYAFGGGEQGEKILLSHNFRSSAGVLAAVNAIFERMMREEAGGVDYNDEHRLVYGNRSVADWDRPVEIHLLDTALEPDDSLSEEELQLTASQREAVFVAGALRRLVEEQRPEVFDKRLGGTRPLAYSDVVILMRKTAGVAPVFAEQLALRGIPVYTQESGGYFLTVEIATILSFLQIIDNPLQDIPLLAVLRSPLFSVDDNTVAAWRAERRYGSLYGMLKRCGDPRAQAFIEQLERYMDLARYEPVETLVRRLVFETGYYAFAGGLPNGAERMANLRLLCERAHAFEQDGYKGVSAFIAYIREMIESGKEYTRAKIVGENENAVTIMTIHKSKGLEFPVVFLAGCGQRFNKTDFSRKMVFDERLGVATDVIDMDRHLKYAPYIKKAVVQRRQGEMVSEEMRLLYVALTRAQYKLVAVGSAAGAAGKLETWQRMPRFPFVFANGNSYLEWLGTAADRSLFAVHAAAEVLLGGCAETKHAVSDGAAEYDGALYEEVDRRLRYVYPFEACRFIPSKRSISEMVDRQSEQLLLHRLQTAPDTLTAAQRGTVIHYVLQNIDLGRTGSEAEIQAQLAEMVRRGVLEPAHAGLVDTAALHAFFSSALGMRMKRSGTVYREFRFCVDVPACELMDTELEEPVLVQGVIDCCFAEDDGFVIIDYKTGSLHEKYKLQLELYRRCLALATGRPVKETHIYPLI